MTIRSEVIERGIMPLGANAASGAARKFGGGSGVDCACRKCCQVSNVRMKPCPATSKA